MALVGICGVGLSKAFSIGIYFFCQGKDIPVKVVQVQLTYNAMNQQTVCTGDDFPV